MLEFLETGFTNIIDKLSDVINDITYAISDAFSDLSDTLSDMLTSLLNGIKDVPIKIKNALVDLKDTLVSWFKDLVDNVKSLPGTIKDLFFEMLKTLFVPSDNNNYNKCKDIINDKFSFFCYFSNKLHDFANHDISDTNNYSMVLYNNNVNLFNWSFIDAKIISTVRTFIAGILYLFAFFKIIKSIPRLIKEGRITQ